MIVVTGLMRSGTTPLAKMLHQMGVGMGTFTRFPTHNKNAHFEWEDAPLADPLLAMLSDSKEEAHVSQLLGAYVASRRTKEPWGVKTPFLLPYMKQLRRVCRDMDEPLAVAITERDYAETLRSLERQSDHLEGDELQAVREFTIKVQDKLALHWEGVSHHAELFNFKEAQESPLRTSERLAALAGVKHDPATATRGIRIRET